MDETEIINQAYEYFKDKNIDKLKELSQKENVPQVTFWLGKLLFQNEENWDEAINVFETLKDTNKSDFATLFIGRLLIKKGELKKARKRLKTIIDTNIGNSALYEIGRIRELEGNIPGAKACYFRSLDLKKDAYPYYSLGKIFYEEGSYKSAVKMFKRALALKKNDYYSKFELCKTLIKLEKYDAAEKKLEQLLKVKNDKYVKLELGKIKVLKKQLNEAEELFKSVLRQSPEDCYALHELGMLFYNQKKYKIAKGYFEEVLKHKFNFTSQYYLVKVNRVIGNINEGKKLAEDLLKENPKSPGVLRELGRLHFQLGDFYAAKDYFEKSLDVLYNETTQIDLAETERFLGNFDTAESLLLECNDKYKKNKVLFQLAMINVRRGNMQKALDMLKESVSLNDSDFTILRALIQCYINMDMLNEAVSVIKSHPEIKSSLNVDFLVYLYSQLGLEFDEIDFNNLGYQERQIISYDEKSAIDYMISMQQTTFVENTSYTDLDCNKVFEEVKNLLTDKNRVNELSFGNTYFIKLKSGTEVKVITLPNNDILQILPVQDNEKRYIDAEIHHVVKEA